MNGTHAKQWKPHEKRLIILLIFFGVFGYYFALSRGGNVFLFWTVTCFLLLFAGVIIRYGFSYVETLPEPLRTEIVIALPYEEIFNLCSKFLPSVNCEIDYADRDKSVIMAISTGRPVWSRYLRAHGGPSFVDDRIRFDIRKETKTKNRITFEHNIHEDTPYKIQKERNTMKKIEDYLRQWEVKTSYENSK